ncbi:hypothetical protein [Sinanaerobacter sp. ZZT-01]|uniref:hypothetical protein n=1 Tax=Sinanaerobacter sp. ZZT-01 TaxID=3111540 RepID=UPI002D7A1EE3|nr:hypothetical protein [Sinanaerobacter sp. ZZT-01]WRR93825.1 hypothetical protein U5921_01485 [Sinanaerobacter sp. ZZT-01]
MKEYTLIVKRRRVPVTYEVYKAYYQEYEHERYLKNKAAKHEHSLEQFIETGVSIEFVSLDSITPVEDEVLKTEQIVYLYRCLDKLNAQEQQIPFCRCRGGCNLWRHCCTCQYWDFG